MHNSSYCEVVAREQVCDSVCVDTVRERKSVSCAFSSRLDMAESNASLMRVTNIPAHTLANTYTQEEG